MIGRNDAPIAASPTSPATALRQIEPRLRPTADGRLPPNLFADRRRSHERRLSGPRLDIRHPKRALPLGEPDIQCLGQFAANAQRPVPCRVPQACVGRWVLAFATGSTPDILFERAQWGSIGAKRDQLRPFPPAGNIPPISPKPAVEYFRTSEPSEALEILIVSDCMPATCSATTSDRVNSIDASTQ